jgi:iron(II)-dependent oxidoreductase
MGDPPGAPAAVEWESPQHSLTLPAYQIARYPVTNAQYAAFDAAGGYAERRHWSAAGWAWRKAQSTLPPRHRRYTIANHPVCGVTWYEACAFCAWLTAEWRAAGRIAAGQAVRLPTEAEWEKAARGSDGRRWPWGNEFRESSSNDLAFSSRVLHATRGQGYPELGLTCSVGLFPGTAGPTGCQEMAGQVWEWTCSRWGKETDWARPHYTYPYLPGDGREDQQDPEGALWVLRGGAFDSEPWETRCARRNRDLPDLAVPKFGFRVVVVATLPPPRGLCGGD